MAKAVKRFSITLEGEAAEVLERIPKAVRGVVIGNLLRDAYRLGNLNVVLLDEPEPEENPRKKPKRSFRKKSVEVGPEPRVDEDFQGSETQRAVEAEEQGSEVENSGSGGSEGIEPSGDPDWLTDLRKRVEKKIGL